MKCVFTLFTLFLVIHSFGQSFTAGNLALFIVNRNTNNTPFKIVEINATTVNQSTVIIHAVDSTGTNALRTSADINQTGFLSNSSDGTLLCFTGANSANILGSMDTTRQSSVGIMTAGGTYTMPTTYVAAYPGGQSTGAATFNNTTWYIGNVSGLYTNNATSFVSWPVSYHLSSIKAYGRRAYAIQSSSDGTPALRGVQLTGGVFNDSALGGLQNLIPTGGSVFTDFAMASSQNNGIYDVMYLIQGTGLVKLVKSGTNWIGAREQILTSHFFTMTALTRADGTGIDLYFSSGDGLTTGNSVYKYTDNGSNGATPVINLTAPTLLYTAPSPSIIKGLAFAPKSLTLPIALSSFNASLINSAVQLSWNTATEVNAGAFEVERSSDATQFTAIGTVAASNAPSNYSYTDQQPLSGVSYYRLKLVDKDGSYKYSNTISINNLVTNTTHLSVYPNPVISTFTLTHDKAVTGAVIRIVTIDGRTLFTQSIATGATQSTVDAGKLISGNYLVIFDNNGDRSVTQFIK